MSLRILFADDSVTAQNMGKKILTEAGYQVVAVSNGAAAVKKIAEQKPDIIILDVYMPGYSGLEVCAKVRGSMETAKTPVLLTVGKMEPYKPEDANRVKADGVIVKPFEASDLLAIVKKFEERIRQTETSDQAAPELAQNEEYSDGVQAAEPAMPSPPPQHLVEVPDHMATASAFSDLLGSDTPHSATDLPPATPAYTSARAGEARQEAGPKSEIPSSWKDRGELGTPPPPFPSRSNEPKVESRETPSSPSRPSRPLQIPVYREREQASNTFEMMPTAAPPTGDIEIVRDAALEENAAETTRNTVVDDIAPGLIPSLQQFMQEGSRNSAKPGEPPGAAPVKDTSDVDPSSNAAFEARVAAAMSAYSRSWDAKADRSAASSDGTAPDRGSEAAESSPVPFERQTPVRPPTRVPGLSTPTKMAPFVVGNRPAPAEEKTDLASEPARVGSQFSRQEPSQQPEAGRGANHASSPSSVEASALAAAAAAAAAAGADAGADPNTIAQAVSRVMERIKPELVEEIVRELKSKK